MQLAFVGAFVTLRAVDQEVNFTRARLMWSDTLDVAGASYSIEQILKDLEGHLTDERRRRLEQVVSERSTRVAAVLENIYDRGNVSAVMRSFEGFGFLPIHLVDQPGARFKAANRVTRGADKWLDVHQHATPLEAVRALKAEGRQIWATDLNTHHSIDDLDWSKPMAVVLGNEKEGVSPEMLELVDGRFRIPMAGFSQSFNISVAAALIFYRARFEAKNCTLNSFEQRQLLANYYLRCFDNPGALLRAHAR